MVEETREQTQEKAALADNADVAETAGAKSKRLLRHRWVALFVAATVLIQGAGFIYVRYLRRPTSPQPSPEIPLGKYRFLSAGESNGAVEQARFSLRVALLEGVEADSRRRLADYRYRVQQNVEELLRQAHAADFEDPRLGELKRQLQEKINTTLGARVVADVIITDLQVTRGPRELHAAAAPETADNAAAPPWQQSSDVAAASSRP